MTTARGIGWLLGRVMVRGARVSPGNRVATVLGSFVLCSLALATVGTLQLFAIQHDRSVALRPTVGIASDGRDTDLRVVDPRTVTTRRWNGHDIARQFYTGDGSGPDIAGIPRIPAPGGYYASPELVDLIERDGVVAALFDDRSLAGVIAPSGLVHPHELRAIGAADPDLDFGLVPVTGFGSPSPPYDGFSTINRAVGLFAVLCIWVPGVTLLVMTSRLAATETRRRARALHLVGVSRRMIRGFHVGEVGVFVLGGALLGAGTFHGWIRATTHVPWTDGGYFARDIDPGFLTTAALIIALTLCAMTAASLAADPSRTMGVVSRHASPRLWRNWSPCLVRLPGVGLMMFVGALLYLVGLTFLTHPPRWAVLGMWVADGALAIGLGLCGPALVTSAFARFSSVVRRGGVLVGVRMQSRGPSTSVRLGAVLAIIIVLVIGAMSFINVLRQGDSASWNSALAEHPKVPVVATDISNTLTLAEVERAAPGTHPVEQVNGRMGPMRVKVLVGDCEDLAVLGGRPPHGCSGQPQWIGVKNEPLPDRDQRSEVHVVGRGTLVAPGPTAIVDASSRLPQSWHGALLVPHEQFKTSAGENGTFFLLTSNDELGRTLAKLSGTAPMVQFSLAGLTKSDPYATRFPDQVTWLVVGALIAIGLGALGMVTIIIGEARERSAQMRGLRTLGASRADVVMAHVWATAGPVVAMGWLGVTGGLTVACVMHTFDPRAQVEWIAAFMIALVTLAFALTSALVTLPSAFLTARRSGGLEA